MGKIYIGSVFDLSKRLKDYFYFYYLKQANSCICNALINYNHSAFSLSIVEYIDISNLSKKETVQLILEREQNYLNQIFSENKSNTYNILKIAGSRLGSKHSLETIAKISEESNHMSGRIRGGNHHLFGKLYSEKTKNLMSEALIGKNNPRRMLGKKTFYWNFR